jgi:hypothetical protein
VGKISPLSMECQRYIKLYDLFQNVMQESLCLFLCNWQHNRREFGRSLKITCVEVPNTTLLWHGITGPDTDDATTTAGARGSQAQSVGSLSIKPPLQCLSEHGRSENRGRDGFHFRRMADQRDGENTGHIIPCTPCRDGTRLHH